MNKLLKIEDVRDDHLKFNVFILSGYRWRLKPWPCFWSIFQLHNETGAKQVMISDRMSTKKSKFLAGNIWLHLMPLLFFLNASFEPWEGAPWYFASAVVPCALCLVCSVVYHTFMASSSKDSYKLLLFIDYLSVFNTMIWPEAMVIGWSFACNSFLRTSSFLGVCVLILKVLSICPG